MTLVGGHKGYDVHRLPLDPDLVAATEYGPDDTMIVHVAKDEWNAEWLPNEETALQAMAGSGFAPEWLATRRSIDGSVAPHGGLMEVYETDLGDTEPHSDGEALRHAIIRLLAAIRVAGLRHGDLSFKNLIVKQNGHWVGAIDWQESHRLRGGRAPQRTPAPDAWMLMQFLWGHEDTQGRTDIPRVARRWQAVLGDLGAAFHHDDDPLPLLGRRFADLGCFQGDFVALASCEGMEAFGYDTGGFRSGENSIEIGQRRWATLPRIYAPALIEADLFSYGETEHDIAMCFSTWIYMVQQRGQEAAQDWLAYVIQHSEVLYFETQTHGDGPGPEWLPDDAAVEELLRSLGAGEVKPIITIPVSGTAAPRTVWAVR